MPRKPRSADAPEKEVLQILILKSLRTKVRKIAAACGVWPNAVVEECLKRSLDEVEGSPTIGDCRNKSLVSRR